MPEFVYTTEELKRYIGEIIGNEPMSLYHRDIVYNDQRTKSRPYYVTAEGEPFCKIIAEQVLLHREKFFHSDRTRNNRYKIRRKSHSQNVEKLKSELTTAGSIENYITCAERAKGRKPEEERLMQCLCAQGNVGKFYAIDYQVPTADYGHDKIDLVLKCGGDHYITEGKKFGSNESFLRCVLEIQTYYANLSEQFLKNNGWELDKVKKAVLVDGDSFAYKQFKTEKWAKELTIAFDVQVLLLSHDENWKFDIIEL